MDEQTDRQMDSDIWMDGQIDRMTDIKTEEQLRFQLCDGWTDSTA